MPEPLPSAVVDDLWFGDDPSVGSDVDWHEWVTRHPGHTSWMSKRWLGGSGRLGAQSPEYTEARLALPPLRGECHLARPSAGR